MKAFFILSVIISASLVASCKKDDKNSETVFSGSVEFTNPHEGDTLTGNFGITGTITGNTEMHGYHIGIYRRDNEDLIYENQYHIHASSYSIAENVIHTLTDTTDLKVVVEVVLEHEGNDVTKTVNFVYKP